MKIAMLCYPSSGGSGVVATELGLELARKGHQIHFITSDVPFRLMGSWKKNVFYHDVEIVDYPLFKYPPYESSLANKIYNVVLQEKIDIIHSHYAVPYANTALLVKNMLQQKGVEVKTITTIHGSDVSIMGHDPSLKDIISYSVNNSDAVTSVSDQMAEEAVEVLSLSRKPEVIYNFVDIKPQKKPEENLKEIFGFNNAKIITHISNFRMVKRIEDVIKIFAKIDKKIPSRLLLIGDGPEQRAAHRLAGKLGLINKITFLGLQNSISKLLSVTDVFLLPSEKENFSLSALEAMGCGVPVIATKVGGMPEMITNAHDGFLAEVGDIDTMANYAIDVLQDKDLYRKISENAKKKVSKKFIPGIIIPQYVELYKNLLKK